MTTIKEITPEEHKLIMDNCEQLGEKIKHPIELGETQLKNIVKCIRETKKEDLEIIGAIKVNDIFNKVIEEERKLGQYARNVIPTLEFIENAIKIYKRELKQKLEGKQEDRE